MAVSPHATSTAQAPWLGRLKVFVEKKPIIILTFDGHEWDRLQGSRRGVSEFTVARAHDLLEDVKVPVPCLISGKSHEDESLHFGMISSRSAVTTLESRIKVRRAVRIQPRSKSELLSLVTDKPYGNNLRRRLHNHGSVIALSSKLSGHLIERLASISTNRGALRAVEESLSVPKDFRSVAVLQEDAVRTALQVFGLSPDDQARSLELVEGRETALARVGIMEDSVIEHDARHVPGYDLVHSDLTGRAVFERGGERLEVFTANRRPLERVFGVDLIYLNVSRQNIVMLQYKMLEPWRKHGADFDWIYRPDDKLDKEIRRMRRYDTHHPPGPYEYRLNPTVFYLKFVKRDGAIRSGGIVVPLDHFDKLRADPACRGPKNALRVSYESLSGRYLRQNAFLDLVRSGYIGAHAEMTEHMKTLVNGVLKNHRSVVAAIHEVTEASPHASTDLDDDTFKQFEE